MKLRFVVAAASSTAALLSFSIITTMTITMQCGIVTAEGDDGTTLSTTATATTNCNELLTSPAVLGCTNINGKDASASNSSGVLLTASYVSIGSVECGDVLSIQQAATAPTITVTNNSDNNDGDDEDNDGVNIIDPNGLYTLVLVDTSSFVVDPATGLADGKAQSAFFQHPILHYGAMNIPGSLLLEGLSLDRTDSIDVFAAYQGPTPSTPSDDDPSFFAPEIMDDRLLVYEYMVGEQHQQQFLSTNDQNVTTAITTNSKIEEFPIDLGANRNQFDYALFFEEIVGVDDYPIDITSTYFVSGECVDDDEDVVESPQEPTTDTPTQAPITVLSTSENGSGSDNETEVILLLLLLLTTLISMISTDQYRRHRLYLHLPPPIILPLHYHYHHRRRRRHCHHRRRWQ